MINEGFTYVEVYFQPSFLLLGHLLLTKTNIVPEGSSEMHDVPKVDFVPNVPKVDLSCIRIILFFGDDIKALITGSC